MHSEYPKLGPDSELVFTHGNPYSSEETRCKLFELKSMASNSQLAKVTSLARIHKKLPVSDLCVTHTHHSRVMSSFAPASVVADRVFIVAPHIQYIAWEIDSDFGFH